MPQQPIETLELSPKHLQQLQDVLSKQVPNNEVWAYGSRVNGTSHEGSDLDLVIFGEDVDFSELLNAFQESLLPMLVDVHLWERLPESFQQNIQKRYVVVQQGIR